MPRGLLRAAGLRVEAEKELVAGGEAARRAGARGGRRWRGTGRAAPGQRYTAPPTTTPPRKTQPSPQLWGAQHRTPEGPGLGGAGGGRQLRNSRERLGGRGGGVGGVRARTELGAGGLGEQ